MKDLFRRILLFLIFALFSIALFSQQTEIPVTSDSQEAMELYNKAVKAMDDSKMRDAITLSKEASELDPNFFMPNNFLAIYYLYFNNQEQFRIYSKKALESNYDLSKGEILMQKALKKLSENPEADVTEFGLKLVELHPKSFRAYQMLSTYQQFAGKNEAQNKTLSTMLKLTENQAPIYNNLGYNYMALNKMDKAKESFEKYMELAPEEPNTYDSMGDYLIKIKKYKKAYKHFMKAYELDTINYKFSFDKAVKAKSN